MPIEVTSYFLNNWKYSGNTEEIIESRKPLQLYILFHFLTYNQQYFDKMYRVFTK